MFKLTVKISNHTAVCKIVLVIAEWYSIVLICHSLFSTSILHKHIYFNRYCLDRNPNAINTSFLTTACIVGSFYLGRLGGSGVMCPYFTRLWQILASFCTFVWIYGSIPFSLFFCCVTSFLKPLPMLYNLFVILIITFFDPKSIM